MEIQRDEFIMLINLKDLLYKNIIIIGLLITLVIAIILRFKGLTFQSYWLDELISVGFSNPARSFSSMYEITVNDVHPPLYQILLWSWFHVFGFSEYAGRALSAVAGTLSVFAIYLLGKELFNKEVGLYAAIIAAINPFLIYYSQEVRSYSLLFLLSTISYVYFMRVLTRYSHKNFILYLLLTVALIYTHYFGLFLVATQAFVFIYFFIKNQNQHKHLYRLALIISATFIVALLPLIPHILSHAGKSSFWIQPPSNWFFIDYMRKYTKSIYHDLIFLIFSAISLGFLFVKKEKNTYKNMTIILIIWIIIGYLLPYIRSVTAIPLLTPRNTIVIIPALVLLVAYGIYLLKGNAFKVSALVVILVFSWHQTRTSNYYHKVNKQQWREVLLSIKHTNDKMPIYAFNSKKYIAYNSMLDLDLKIQTIDNVNKNLNTNALEKCFLVVDSHGDNIKDDTTLQNKDIKEVLEIKKHAARGVLYAYKTPTDQCLELYNGAY